MFRSKNESEISDELFLKITNPINSLFDNFLNEFVFPECCAYYLASGYNTDSLWEEKLNVHINTVYSLLGQPYSNLDYKSLKNKIEKILKIKYNLKIVNENPLDFEPEYKKI